MADWANFDTVFRSRTDYSFDQKQIDAIANNRKELGGILFFDRICTSTGLKQSQKWFPPKSNADLRSLWQKIGKAEVSDEKKQAILFYILKECKLPGNVDLAFARKVYLPIKYQILVGGLWELDHVSFSRALEYLTDSSLSPEFADDILLTLLTATECDSALAMAYYLTVKPPLAKHETLQIFFELLIETNVVEAYHFCSKREVPVHKMLFEELLRSVHEDATSLAKAKRLTNLWSIPFTEQEETWLEEYLLRGPGSKIVGAKDSLLIRRLITGRQMTASGVLDRYRGPVLDDVNWDVIRSMIEAAAG